MSTLRSSLPLALSVLLVASGCGAPGASSIARAQAGALAESPPIGLGTILLPPVVVRGEPVPEGPERTLEARMADVGVPGFGVAVVRGGRLAWTASFGVADAASGRPVTEDTLFQAASISKPLAAMGALTYVREGRLGLDEDVNGALRSWRVEGTAGLEGGSTGAGPVTLRDLLSHTAGLGVGGFPGYAAGEVPPDAVGVLEGRGNTEAVRLVQAPGTSRSYSGGGYTVVQVLLEDVDVGERDFATLMRERVLEPLGMRNSTFEQPLPEALHGRAASGHGWDGEPLAGGWHTYPEQAAAGLWTTPADLARFALAVQRGLGGEDGPVLPAELVAEMARAPVEPGYGLGLSLGAERFGHGGGNAGFICALTAFMEGGNGAVIMTNADPGWTLQSEVMRTIFAVEGWPGLEPEEKVVVELGPERLAALAGSYSIPGLGTVVLEVHELGDRLSFTLPDGGTGELRAESASTFFEPVEGAPVEFEFATSGEVLGFGWEGYEARRIRPGE